jgi:predicted ribosome quality control (RQC) complex YloA/Tae2 family protein
MLTHYFTLKFLARELNERLRDATVKEVFSQRRNELLISCSLESRAWTLILSCDPRWNYLFLRDSVARAKKNSVDLFNDALHRTIRKVLVDPNDRILKIALDDDLTLAFLPFGSTANVFLVDHDRNILDAFKRSREFVGKGFRESDKVDAMRTLGSLDTFAESLQEMGEKNIFSALKARIPGLGSTLAREVIHRSRIDEKHLVKFLTSEEIAEVFGQLQGILKELDSPHPTVYYRGDSPRIFSLISLQHFGGSRAESFENVNEAIRTFVVQSFRTQAIDTEKNVLLSKIKNAIERSRRTLAAIEEELQQSSRADEYERIAKLLMANLQHLTKGTKFVDLPDMFSGNRPMRIILDPKLTPALNAERYFHKAKKGREAREETSKRLEKVRSDLAFLGKLQLHLDSCTTKEQLKEFQEEYKSELVRWNIVKTSKAREEIPFRVFTVTGGFEVWAGKSSENNDLLTMKYAKPNDLWFHARGGSGSHVVLKVDTAKGNPSREAIEQAAGIAAYYSKMKKAKMVPVAYCERKYVKKMKATPPGTVSLQREKVIFVEPSLPVPPKE